MLFVSFEIVEMPRRGVELTS